MPSAPSRPGPPAPLPLGGPSLAELASRATKGWLLALLEDRPLSSSGEVRVSALAERGPALCHAVLRAMASDAELDWLGDEDGRRLAREVVVLAGSPGATGVVEAVEALRRGLRDALASADALADPGSTARAADRLAHVCARLAAAAIKPPAADEQAPDGLAELAAAGDGGRLRRDREDVHAGRDDDDEQEADAVPRDDPGDAGQDHFTAPFPAPRPLSSIPRRDARPLWMAALERQLAEGGRSGRRFALLLIEVDGADRLRLAGPPPVVEDVLAGVGRAVREHVRRADLLAHEDDGRLWVIAPDAGRAGGHALAARLAGAVEGAGRLRGAALGVSIGAAFYPDDGRDALTLTEHAEEAMFAARASGLPLADGAPEPVGGGFGA